MTPVCIGIVMGSESDLEIMQDAVDILTQFKVPFEVTVVSAHRTPKRLVHYSESARERGLQVIIAGAGGAAHLPGMVASMTPIPVIGVPINRTPLNGLDSLLSIVQMPGGVPVATVAINQAKNAAILAVQILGVAEPARMDQIDAYKQQLAEQVLKTANPIGDFNPHS
jgi:5-(carboxyamino)imidazole ribonucleotide mutase